MSQLSLWDAYARFAPSYISLRGKTGWRPHGSNVRSLGDADTLIKTNGRPPMHKEIFVAFIKGMFHVKHSL